MRRVLLRFGCCLGVMVIIGVLSGSTIPQTAVVGVGTALAVTTVLSLFDRLEPRFRRDRR